MDLLLYVIVALLVVAAIVMAAILLNVPIFGSGGAARTNLKNIVNAQRGTGMESVRGRGKVSIFESAEASQVDRTRSARLTLRKRLKYAQWKISPIIFHLMELGVSIVCFGISAFYVHFIVQLMVFLISGPLIVRWLLNTAVERRFKAFDADYAPFLMSLVSLLKTGMNPMTALETSALGLEEGSTVRSEVEMMIERLRFGVQEDRSIGSFGEDIFHPEIELFVQALLLSRRVGGTLSDTLERLAKQVRRRQYFRASANAAVGLQRGSIWFIIGILVSLEVYLYFVYPEAVTGAMRHPIGWVVWQFAGVVIFLGMFWVRQVTKIRV